MSVCIHEHVQQQADSTTNVDFNADDESDKVVLLTEDGSVVIESLFLLELLHQAAYLIGVVSVYYFCQDDQPSNSHQHCLLWFSLRGLRDGPGL